MLFGQVEAYTADRLSHSPTRIRISILDSNGTGQAGGYLD